MFIVKGAERVSGSSLFGYSDITKLQLQYLGWDLNHDLLLLRCAFADNNHLAGEKYHSSLSELSIGSWKFVGTEARRQFKQQRRQRGNGSYC